MGGETSLVSFRARVTVAAAGAVALAVIALSALAYVIVRSELRGEVDRSLRAIASRAATAPAPPPAALRDLRLPPPRFGAAAGYLQIVLPNGRTVRPAGGATPLPVTGQAAQLPKGSQTLQDAHVGGVHVRILTARPRRIEATLQVARPLTEVDRVLRKLALLLVVVAAGGAAVAAAAGFAVARSTIAPVARLTSAAEHVAETQDLSARIDHRRDDELGRLASAFNRMLEALRHSRAAQRQLVADASHELRTPLTSLRANLELIDQIDKLDVADRAQMLRDVRGQAEEMSMLVADLIDLARDGQSAAARQPLRLDEVVADAIDRVAARGADVRFDDSGVEPMRVVGDPDALERAIVNLLDNAVKWSPAGGSVEVSARASRLTVRDHGPGISDADLPFVFDRFYRSAEARSRPGSGLGLAIVRQVAEAHGGSAFAQRAPDGGARLVMHIPVVSREPAPGGMP